MTLSEITHMCLELLREGQIVDDERLDKRLIRDWVIMKRAQFIKNDRAQNPNNKIDLNLYQTLSLTVSVEDVTDVGDYPYADDDTQLYEIVTSTSTIPSIIEDKSGPIIYSLESQDKMKLPFSVVPYDHLRFAGNGKFNTGIIFGSIRDNYVYFKYNSFFDTYTTVLLKAVFEDPTLVTGFSEETSRFPINVGMIEYIKNAIIDKDFRMFLSGEADEISDSSGEIKT